MKKILLSTLLTSMSFTALAVTSVDISVIGTISSASCTPSASGNGVVDYGFIKPDTLAKTGPTVLEVKTIGFVINCDSKTNIAIRATSNRRGTTTNVEGPESQVGSAMADASLIAANLGKNQPYGQSYVTSPTVVGLGTSNGKNIGGYMMNLPPSLVTLDGVNVTNKYYTKSVPTSQLDWSKESASLVTNNGHTLFTVDNAFFAYGTDPDGTKPSAFSTLTGTLLIQAYITDKSNLDFSSPIRLDGSSSIEIYYY